MIGEDAGGGQDGNRNKLSGMKTGNFGGFRSFHQEAVGDAPCRKLEGGGGRAKPGKSRGCETRKEAVKDRQTTVLSAMA